MNAEQVLAACDRLKQINSEYLPGRQRIRHIMNGGSDGVYATMAWDMGKGASMAGSGRDVAAKIGIDLPTVNLVASGLDRLAQAVGVPPTLKLPYGPRDSDTARRKAEKRERIIEGWDLNARMELHYPQLGRWLPGYGYAVWTLMEKLTPEGAPYPAARLRDPYDVYPGWFGPDQTPKELAIVRRVPIEALMARYKRDDWDQRINMAYEKYATSAMVGPIVGGASWEGTKQGVEVYEYYCSQGTYMAVPECELVLDFYPNPLKSGPPFVFMKRFAFDRLESQYHHVIGLMSMMAKMNILGLISSEDSVFRETNIIGELRSNTYKRGRFAVNEFEPGSRIEKATVENQQNVFNQIDRLERQLRIGANYDVQQDGMGVGGWNTGRGLQELQTSATQNTREYQLVIKYGNEELDSKRLEWDEQLHPLRKRKVFYMDGSGREFEETYMPKEDINGNYRSRRVYGMMATWDDNSKIVAGLQLLQAEAIDTLTLQENLHGLDDVTRVNDRIAQERAYKNLGLALEQMAAQGDPRAAMVLAEIAEKPQDRMKILKKFFTPEEPQMSPEEEEMAGMGMGAELELAGGQPPPVQTVLSRLTGGGQAEGGVQTVAAGTR